MMHSTTRVLAAMGAALVLMIGGAVAYAQIPSADGTITACYIKPTSNLRVINADTTSCKKGETTLTWNQQGEPGTDGADGVSGFTTVTKHDSVNVSDGDFITVLVACPMGKVAFGGGGNGVVTSGGVTGGLADIRSSFPIEGDADEPSEWAVRFGKADGSNFVQGQGVDYTLFVTCANAI